MALKHVDGSSLMFLFVAALACVTKLATTAIVTCLTATSLLDGRLYALAATTSAIDILGICTFLAAIAVFLQRLPRRALFTIWIPSAILCFLGAILSLIVLACTARFANDAAYNQRNISTTRASAAAGLAIGIVGLIPQTAFFISIWPHPERTASAPIETVEERSSPARSTKRRSISVHLASIGPASPKFFRSISEPTSPSLSGFSSSPRSSLRNSANNVLRPMTSRTRLLIGSSLASTRDSRSLHSTIEPVPEATRQNDEFENWDTSRVEEVYDSPFGSKSRVTKLETIPGSRPVSPAHALDGPFGDRQLAEDTPLPESPLQPPSACVSPSSETSSLQNFPPRPSARRPSTANDQSHIHPLFRTESPVPPPLASPGTVITASPYAGQIVSPEAVLSPRILHSAPGSRPGTPTLLIPSRSRTGSVRSNRTNAASSSIPTSPISPIEQLPMRSLSQLSQSRTPQSND